MLLSKPLARVAEDDVSAATGGVGGGARVAAAAAAVLRDGGRVGRAELLVDVFNPGWPLSKNGCRRFGDALVFIVPKLVARSLLVTASSAEGAALLRGDELLEGAVVLLFIRSGGDRRVGLLLLLRVGEEDTGGVFERLPPPLL